MAPISISVIIPVYKVERYVEQCLNSVLRQTLQDIEIILVDDASPDSSLSIIQQVKANYAGSMDIRIISHPVNRGLSAARNTGLAKARGEFIYFLDSDDYLSPDALCALLTLARDTQAEIVMGGVIQADEEGRALQEQIYQIRDAAFQGREEILEAFQTFQIYISGWNKLIQHSWLKKHDIVFDESYLYEDWPWCLRLALNAGHMACMNHPCYYYVSRPGSIMDGMDLRKCRGMSRMIRKLEEILQDAGMEDRMSPWLRERYRMLRGHIAANFHGLEKNIILADCFSRLEGTGSSKVLSWKKRVYTRLWKKLPEQMQEAIIRYLTKEKAR